MILRRLVVVAVALLLAVQAAREAAVDALAGLRPASAAKVWPGHPAVEISLGLAEIGRAAGERKPIDPHTLAMIGNAAMKSPLAPEPFLVRGVQAQTGGDPEAAKRAFLAAQWRDPRSMPAAYFLSNYYFEARQPLQGLQQIVLLARMYPSGNSVIAPFIAAYAHDRSNWPAIRTIFRSGGTIEGRVLAELAKDPRNADTILALADAGNRNSASPWLARLLTSLVASRDYAKARAIWSSIGGGRPANELIFDPGFSRPGPPPPFNWTLASSTVGLAERQPGKRLHVIFYGNEDGVLASQLLLLPPGAYRMQTQLAGSSLHPEALLWSIRCDGSDEPIAIARIDAAAKQGWTFKVPANCPAEDLELSGRSGDIAQQSEATITGLTLMRVGTDA